MAIFIDIPGIFGENYIEKRKDMQLKTQDDHWGWIRANNANFKITNPEEKNQKANKSTGTMALGRSTAPAASGAGAAGAVPKVEPLSFSKNLDFSTPAIAKAVLSKKQFFATAVMHVTNTQSEVIFKLEMEQVRITDYSFDLGDAATADPSESITLSFKKVKGEYIETSREFYHDRDHFEWSLKDSGDGG